MTRDIQSNSLDSTTACCTAFNDARLTQDLIHSALQELHCCAASALLSLTQLCVITVQEEVLLAYQVCFDLFENEMQSFLLKASV